jgi:hypothetical protein
MISGAMTAPEQSSPRLVSTLTVEARVPFASRELTPPTTAEAGCARIERAQDKDRMARARASMEHINEVGGTI